MFRVVLKYPQEVIVNGKEVLIQPQTYRVDDVKFCKDNDFIQCGGCKDWFDETNQVGLYHPKYDENNNKEYCEECFSKKYH